MNKEFMKIVEEQKLIGFLESIEELEPKIAPDGGETVLPLAALLPKRPKR